jgi:hypothetical protein
VYSVQPDPGGGDRRCKAIGPTGSAGHPGSSPLKDAGVKLAPAVRQRLSRWRRGRRRGLGSWPACAGARPSPLHRTGPARSWRLRWPTSPPQKKRQVSTRTPAAPPHRNPTAGVMVETFGLLPSIAFPRNLNGHSRVVPDTGGVGAATGGVARCAGVRAVCWLR